MVLMIMMINIHYGFILSDRKMFHHDDHPEHISHVVMIITVAKRAFIMLLLLLQPILNLLELPSEQELQLSNLQSITFLVNIMRKF